MASQVEISVPALDTMPQFQKNDLSRFVLEFVDMVFSRPGEEEKYQEWLKARKEKHEQA